MINIKFPDGNVRQYESGITPFQVAESISPRFAADVLAAKINGEEWDISRPILEDSQIQLFKWDDAEGKHAFWHSSAHLLAEALQELYPGVKFGIGPAIENGFYYDIDLGDEKITEDDIAKIIARFWLLNLLAIISIVAKFLFILFFHISIIRQKTCPCQRVSA